jgi:hypothetical protein
MGSFATSLHVKANDSNRVAATLREILAEGGWQTTEKIPDAGAGFAGPPTLRGLHVSAPRNGWVSILDTDLLGAHELVSSLAQRLATHAIFVFVNDSDSWSYRLADAQGGVSEFDSAEQDQDVEGEYDDLVQAGPAIAQLQTLMQDGSILQKMQDIQTQMSAAAPPHIREAEARMKGGTGTAADIRVYQAWAMQEMPKYTTQMKSILGGALDPFRAAQKQSAGKKPKRQPTKAARAAQQKRLEPLRPILAAGVTDEQVQAVFETKAVFAEEVLAEFLPLIGIGSYYATLSYRYLEEAGDDELAAENIRFIHHFRFETNSPPQFAQR